MPRRQPPKITDLPKGCKILPFDYRALSDSGHRGVDTTCKNEF